MAGNFPAQKEDIRLWLLEGIKRGATHCMIIYDSWDFEDYPHYVMPGEDVREEVKKFDDPNAGIERLMEVYNLNMDIESQLNEALAMNY